MADEENDDVFELGPGIIDNDDAPLIPPNNLEGNNNDFGVGNGLVDVHAHGQPIEDENQELLLIDLLQNHLPVNIVQINGFGHSPSASTEDASSSNAFDPDDIIASSSPSDSVFMGAHANEGYLSDSEISDFTSSIEVEPEACSAERDKGPVRGDKPEIFDYRNVEYEAKMQGTGTSCIGNNERDLPNPPNSPVNLRTNSQAFRTLLQIPDSITRGSGPDTEQPASNVAQENSEQVQRPVRLTTCQNVCLKLGSFMLLSLFPYTLAIIATLEGLFPKVCFKVVGAVWVITLFITICLFVKACQSMHNDDERSPSREESTEDSENPHPDNS